MTGASGGMVERMIRAAMLQNAVYEEVEADEGLTGQAAGVVAVVAVARGIGAFGEGAGFIVGGVVTALVGWLIWAGVTYLIGDKLLGGTATWGELLRTLGFAQAPGVLFVAGIIPFLGGLVEFAAAIWVLAAGIVAIRQALDFGTGKALLTAVLGWVALAIPAMIFGF